MALSSLLSYVLYPSKSVKRRYFLLYKASKNMSELLISMFLPSKDVLIGALRFQHFNLF